MYFLFKAFFILSLLQLTSLSYADSQAICVLNEKDDVIQSLANFSTEVEINNPEDYSYNDKFKHCAGSCLLAKRCGILSTAAVGVLKELMDAFGDGNPEMADLVANTIGLRISENVYSERMCFLMCQKFYPVFVPSPTL